MTSKPLECSTHQECVYLPGGLGPCLMVYAKCVLYSRVLGPQRISLTSIQARDQGQPRRWSMCLCGRSAMRTLGTKALLSFPSWQRSMHTVTHCCWEKSALHMAPLERAARSSVPGSPGPHSGHFVPMLIVICIFLL